MNLNHMTNQKMELGLFYQVTFHWRKKGDTSKVVWTHDSSSLTRKDSRTKGAREEGRL
jgi:hypothetical protein